MVFWHDLVVTWSRDFVYIKAAKENDGRHTTGKSYYLDIALINRENTLIR